MKGFPKILNSKKDYENIIDDFGYCKKVKRAYEGLLQTAKHYTYDKELALEEDPSGLEPDYKVIEEKNEEGNTIRTQFKLVENKNGKLFKLGFTESEVQGVIDKC